MIKFEDSVIDVYGEEKYKLLTINVDNKTVGYIDYSVFEDTPYIKYIEVKDEYRRKGYGKKLVEKLQSLYPDSEIGFGMMTDDGSKLYKSLKKEIIPNKDYPKKIQYLEKINNWLKKYGSIIHKDLEDWSEEDIAYLRKYADIWKKYHDKQQDIEDWLNNNKKQIVKIKHNLNESWSDNYDLYDIYENYQPYNVLMEFENGEKNIWFPLIKPSEYKQALLEFMKMGELVRFPKDKVFKWLEIIMKNTCIIDAITALAGHTQWFPYGDCSNVYDELEDAETDYYIFSEFLDKRGFYDWCKLPDGSDAWSDYGLQPLWNILDEYQENMTAEQVLVLVNRCLDVYHQRGDLASAFIEGGSSSLTKISNESVELKETPISDEEYDNLKVGNKVVYDDNNSKMIQPSKYDTVVAKDKDTVTTQTRHHSGRARTNVKWNKDHFKRKFSLKESLSFEPTDDDFEIGGKEFHEEGSKVYNIYDNDVKIGMLAITEYQKGISLDGLEIFKKYRKQGFGKKVVDLLKKKYKGIYVRAIPSAKKFWQKQGHDAYYNNDSGTYDGDLIYDFDESKLNESVVYRGYDKKYGVITHPDWIYVTGDLEQAKYYASRDGSIKNGGVIEYNIDDDLNFLTIDEVNEYMSEYDEEYSIDDLLWYQQGLSDDLIEYGDGIVFEDPNYSNHLIYILFDEKYLKNGKEINLNEKLNEEYEGLNRIAGFYWFDEHRFQMLKRKPVGVEELDPEDNEFDYYHLDDKGLEEDNKARFGIEKLGKKIVCYIESENKQKCLKAKKAIQKKFNNILIDKFQLSWGRDGFEELNESIEQMDYSDEFGGIVYPKIILKNPTKKELRDFKDVKEWRVMKHKDGSWYFFVGYIHNELPISDISDVNGIFYHNKENTFYIRYGNDEVYSYFDENDSVDEIKGYLYNDEYIMNTFTNLKVKLITTSIPLEESIAYAESNNDYNRLKNRKLNESVYPENKYVFPYPDWGNLADIIDPNDNYRYWVDGIEAKIKNPQLKNIPVNKIRQDYDGDDDCFEYDYNYNQFDNGINTPIDVVKYKDQYILMDGHHRAAYAKVNGLKIIKAYVYDADKLKNLNESIAYAESNNDDLVNVILKNPTRKELYDNCTESRVVIDTSTGDFYFCAAGDFIHDQMIDKIGVGSNDSMFYDYYENTFYIRDEWEDEKELEEFYNENKGWLSAYPYIQKNMPNFKLKMMDIYGPETPWD